MKAVKLTRSGRQPDGGDGEVRGLPAGLPGISDSNSARRVKRRHPAARPEKLTFRSRADDAVFLFSAGVR